MTATNPRFQLSPTALKYLGWAVTAAIVIFAYFNIQPYERAVRLLFGANDLSGIAQFILDLPGVGLLINGLGNLVIWILGAILWFVIQVLELLPLMLFNNRKALKSMIKQSSGGETFKVEEGDDPTLATLKRAYNKLPYRLVRQFRQYALFAYTVDLFICLAVYPPVDGSVGRLLLVLSTGAFQLLNWQNILLLLVTLFAIEILVGIGFMVADLRAAIARSTAGNDEV
ncbi:hypothetical protein [Leptolyngbya sp. FACHB-16]|uniref:hypothetical protein n=1 Tax=unclassified Leptolyngbya TaxID=2650499 RepID=UPI0016892A3E|nr:hypothetical protein [Leptolyngbya sp. FACHB-16]MBD2156027.1 hypothetical protein [Leptolyngbya sp. FACHB-16]